MRAGLLSAACAVAAIGAVVLARKGVTVHEFPPYLPDGAPTDLAQYSGPWITAAAACLLVAGLCGLFAAAAMRRPHRVPATPVAVSADGPG